MANRHIPVLLGLTLLGTAGGAVLADNAKAGDPAADAELLEFLGSVDSGADSQDGSWIEYLSQTDIGKVAKTADPPGAAQARQAAVGPQASASGDKK